MGLAPPALRDHRGAAAVFATSARWRTVVRLASRPDFGQQHINVLEAKAILFLIRWLVRRGASDARVLVLSDSRVCVGAFGKGRSSSRQLNFVLRQVAGLAIAARVYAGGRLDSDVGEPR